MTLEDFIRLLESARSQIGGDAQVLLSYRANLLVPRTPDTMETMQSFLGDEPAAVHIKLIRKPE